ncbi:MAG: hypothetical protein IKG03_07330 [Clostridiales bacterium]|nr:hypothetical protein [Clostridiales bacterium]
MNIVFNEDFYKRLCNNKSQGYTVSKVLSGKGKRIWTNSLNCDKSSDAWKLWICNKTINPKKGTKTNLIILLTFGLGIEYEGIRSRMNRNSWDEESVRQIDQLFLPSAPVYIDWDAFIQFLDYSSELYVTSNDKLILYTAISHEAWTPDRPLSVTDVVGEIRSHSTKVADKLGEKTIRDRVEVLEKKKIIRKTDDGRFYLNLDQLIPDYNSYRNYPEPEDP